MTQGPDNLAPSHHAIDPMGRIAVDAECLGCEYNLRGLASDSTCSECGRPIAESFDLSQLRFAPADSLRPLRSLADWVFIAMLALPFTSLFFFACLPSPINVVVGLLGFLAPASPLWFMLIGPQRRRFAFPWEVPETDAPKPGLGDVFENSPEATASLNDAIRWWNFSLVAFASAFCVCALMHMMTPRIAGTLSSLAVWAVAFIACVTQAKIFDWFAALARRVPDRAVAGALNRASRGSRIFAQIFFGTSLLAIAWSFMGSHGIADCFLYTVAGLCGIIGVLGAPVVYCYMLYALIRFRQRLTRLI